MSVALDSGLEVTALHNHFFWDAPKVMFMHIGGMGDEDKLAAAVGKVFAKMQGDERWQGRSAEGRHRSRQDVARSQEARRGRSARTATTRTASTRSVIGRTTKMHGGEVGKRHGRQHLGGLRRAATTRRSSTATSPCSRRELQAVLKALRGAGINIVAIHQHMTGEAAARPVPALLGRRPNARTWPKGLRAALDGPDAHSAPVMAATAPARAQRSATSLRYFLRLGTFGFGGPIALAGYMQRDLVERRGLDLASRTTSRGSRSRSSRPGRWRRSSPSTSAGCGPGCWGATLVARRVHPAVVRHGAGALGALRALRRAAVDAGRVLRHRRGGHRHHRAQRRQAGAA